LKWITISFGQIKTITSREYPKMKMMKKTLQESMEIITLKPKRWAIVLA